MDEQRKREILDAAYQNLDRLADLQPRERRIDLTAGDPNGSPGKREGRAAGCSNEQPELTEYERAMQQSNAWMSWTTDAISTAIRSASIAIGEAVAERMEEFTEQLDRKDRQIEALKVEIAKLAAEVAKAQVRLAEADLERDRREREWSPTLRRETIN
jgi:hypothetical protein